MKNNKLIVLFLTGILLFGLSACGEKEQDVVTFFSTQEDALTHFIAEEDVQGSVDLVITMKEEELLIVQKSERRYFVGELLKNANGYYINKISPEFEMVSGAGWEVITENKNEYTISFEIDQAEDAIQLTSEEYYVRLIKGGIISNDDLPETNAIKSMETLIN